MEIACVVLQGNRGLVGELGDEVFAANGVLAHAQFKGCTRDNALEQIRRFRAPRAPVGIHWCRVGEPSIDFHVHLRRCVLASQQGGVQNGGNGSGKRGQVSAQIGVGVHTQGQKLAVFVQGQFGMAGVVTAVGIAQKRLGTVAIPFDVAVEFFGRPSQANIFGIQVNFGAKTTAHIGRNHAHFVFGQAHHKRGQQQAFHVGVLVGHVQRVLVGGAVVAANDGAWLHRVGGQAVVDQVQLGDMGRTGKGRIDSGFFADRPFVAMVVGGFGVQSRGLAGIAHIDDSGQNVVFDFHQFSGILGLFQRFCHHHGHVVAHIAHFAVGQNRVRWLLHGLATGVGDQPATGQAVDFGVHHIRAVQNGHHPGRGQCGRLVNAHNVGMRMGRAHKHRVRHVLHANVIGVVACTGQETVVFLAAQGFANVWQLGKIRSTHD